MVLLCCVRAGSLPAAVAQLSGLQTLHLHNNQLTGRHAELLIELNGKFRQARSHPKWQRRALEQQITSEFVPIHRIRLHICGHPLAGKTQMLKTWRTDGVWLRMQYMTGTISPINARNRTIGIEVHHVAVRGKEFSVWDYGGQVEVRQMPVAISCNFLMAGLKLGVVD